MQCELLDRHDWPTRAGLAQAMFHWIEAFYNPIRCHSTLGYLSPVTFETTATAVADHLNNPVRIPGGHSASQISYTNDLTDHTPLADLGR